MVCPRCGSDGPKEFRAEINIHFRGRAALHNPGVLVFPTLRVCFHCGLAEFYLAENQLHQLSTVDGKDSAA
jgi:hypothetical protein